MGINEVTYCFLTLTGPKDVEADTARDAEASCLAAAFDTGCRDVLRVIFLDVEVVGALVEPGRFLFRSVGLTEVEC